MYYDNGQTELNLVLNTILSMLLSNVEFRKASPGEYRLLQLADFICSIELLSLKQQENRLSKSESSFFYKPQELKKIVYKDDSGQAYVTNPATPPSGESRRGFLLYKCGSLKTWSDFLVSFQWDYYKMQQKMRCV